MRTIEERTDKELLELIKRGQKTKKRLREQMYSLFDRAYYLQAVNHRIERAMYDSRRELARRKQTQCPVLKMRKDSFGTYYSCEARDLMFNSFPSKEVLGIRYCWKCKWTPEQAKVRRFMVLVNGRNRDEKE